MTPPCDEYVPGYGDVNADFHVIGDHPGVHGGLDDEVPFSGNAWSEAFFDALVRGGLLRAAAASREPTDTDDSIAGVATDLASDGNGTPEQTDGRPIVVDRTFLSYLHMCLPDGEPTPDDYADMDRFFDAELRAIVAHVLLPVGARATEHVLKKYTARMIDGDIDMQTLHSHEMRGSGWLVVPIRDPSEWDPGDADRLVESLQELQRTDFQREADLGRFMPGEEPYLVR